MKKISLPALALTGAMVLTLAAGGGRTPPPQLPGYWKNFNLIKGFAIPFESKCNYLH